MIWKSAAALALSFAALPAAAQELNMVDGWYIAEVRPAVCQMVAQFQGTTMISFIASDSNPGMVVLIDESWQLNNGTQYNVQFSWDGWRTSKSIAATANLSSNGRYTVGALTDVATNQAIRRAKRLSVRVPQLRVDGAVTMPAGALAELERCMGAM